MSKQIFHHFSKWEDYKAGFYDSSSLTAKEDIDKSIKLLSNQDEFYKYALQVIKKWGFSCEQNLTDPSINKIAYIGQSACCIANGTPAFMTRNAWSYIDEIDQRLANETAKKVLAEWKYAQMIKGSLWEN